MTQSQALPRLEHGDRLTPAEFHRRYEAHPDVHHAELIEGAVYVPSPARHQVHGSPHAIVIGRLDRYAEMNDMIDVGVESTVYLDDANEVQPDACLFWNAPRNAADIRMTPDGYLQGAPQLIVEIAASSADSDLGRKLEAYRRNGVAEYLVWRTVDGALDWRRLVDGQYLLVQPDAQGMITSATFPGPRLDAAALLRHDRRALRAALQRQ